MRTLAMLLLLAAATLAEGLADRIYVVRVMTESVGMAGTERRVLAAAAVPVGPDGLLMATGFALDAPRGEHASLQVSAVAPDGTEYRAQLLGGHDDLRCTLFRLDLAGDKAPKPVALGASELAIGTRVTLITRYGEAFGYRIRSVESWIEATTSGPDAVYALKAGSAEWRGMIAASADGKRLLGFVDTRSAVGEKNSGALIGVGGAITVVVPPKAYADFIAHPPVPRNGPARVQEPTRKRAWLGVNLQPFNRDRELFFGMPEGTSGALVTGVSKNSPAEKAGVQVHDLLLGVGEIDLRFENDSTAEWARLLRAVGGQSLGEPLPCRVIRFERNADGTYRPRNLDLTIVLEERPLDEEDAPEVEVDHLDIKVRTMTDYRRRLVRLPEGTTGVVVMAVERGSPAQIAGLRPFDIVLGIDRRRVVDAGSLTELLESARKAGHERVVLFVRRNTGQTFIPIAPDWKTK